MTVKKRKKSSRMHGRKMGTHGAGSRKSRKGSGHHGGKGLSGSGKRADHKKTLMIKLYGNKYFGKQGVTSRGTKRDTRPRINLSQIQLNIETYIKKGIAKKSGSSFEINLKKYKILGRGEVTDKLIIKAKEASKTAITKIKKAGGEIEVMKKINKTKKPVTANKE